MGACSDRLIMVFVACQLVGTQLDSSSSPPVSAAAQLATIERNADQLLTALAQPGTRPLAEVAGLVADTNAR